ncbi:uncharacterized protein LOC130990705 [Salvia miltiorrhiza]|uniref:uncharacterized protein LOC130990705 n=1 Tax=Salvia miltiorrhiza TaxID=226208 RepID=UPI0025AC5166|nr:uncharacterized protein LOC130990705 [Salvia miltiorrhiza]
MGRMEPYVESCGICGEFGHGVNECNRIGEFTPKGQAEAYAAQGYQGRLPYEQRHLYNQGQQSSGWKNSAPGQRAGLNQNSQFRQPTQQMGYQSKQLFYPLQPQYPPQQYRQQYSQQYSMPQGNFQPQHFQNAQQMPPPKLSLEETLQSFMEVSKQNMEVTKQDMESQSATIKRLETIVGQLSGTLNLLQQQQQPRKLHGQPLQTH